MSGNMKKSSFLEGTMIATLSIILVKFLGMLYVIPFYATVGVLGSALYAYAYNIYIIFLDISSAGLPSAISKIINEYKFTKYETYFLDYCKFVSLYISGDSDYMLLNYLKNILFNKRVD